MKFQATLFNGETEVIEGRNRQDAISKARLNGDNSWMLISCNKLVKLTKNLHDVVREAVGLKKAA